VKGEVKEEDINFISGIRLCGIYIRTYTHLISVNKILPCACSGAGTIFHEGWGGKT